MMPAVRAIQVQQHVGVMVTASHNDESYNGIKLNWPIQTGWS
jgi:phosphomannomutase